MARGSSERSLDLELKYGDLLLWIKDLRTSRDGLQKEIEAMKKDCIASLHQTSLHVDGLKKDMMGFTSSIRLLSNELKDLAQYNARFGIESKNHNAQVMSYIESLAQQLHNLEAGSGTTGHGRCS